MKKRKKEKSLYGAMSALTATTLVAFFSVMVRGRLTQTHAHTHKEEG